MTIEAGSNSASLPEVAESKSAAPKDSVAAPGPKQPSGESKPRPKTILELIEYAYGEDGRKLNLARRDLHDLKIDQEAAEAEMDLLRRSATADPLLSVPPSILLALAELGAEPPIRRRILELVLAALASHPAFLAHLARLADPAAEPGLSGREVSDAAQGVTFDALGLKEAAEFKDAARERLRVNAVTSFELFRVLRDGWTLDRFVADMASLVWTTPSRRRVQEAAAVLASAKSTDGLSQLSRHFERLLGDADRQTGDARAAAATQSRRANTAEGHYRTLTQQLESERERTQELSARVADLTRSLEAERSSRVVDTSHHVDDYEALRTHVIRRLSAQVELLSDGLHALRNGSTGVAEEFLDRSLSAIEAEATRLRELNGGAR